MHINHSVAGACAIAIRTPVGTIFHTGDFKFDQTPIDGNPADFAAIARIGDDGVLCMLADSTNAERPGHTLSERIVGEAFTNIFARAKGRIIVTSFASNVPRIQQVVDQAVRFNRKVAFLGRSLRNVVHFASELEHLAFPPDLVIKLDDVDAYPPEQVVVMTTGSQGEPMCGADAPVGARSQTAAHRSRRHGRHQRDADSRQREERRKNDQQPLQAGRQRHPWLRRQRRTSPGTHRKKSCC